MVTTVKFWNLCSKRGIKIADVAKCIKVTKEAAEKLLSKNDLASICTKGVAPDASLTAAIPKGSQVPSAEDACLQLALLFSSKIQPLPTDPRV